VPLVKPAPVIPQYHGPNVRGLIPALLGPVGAPVPLYDFTDLSLLMGFQDVWDFDKNHAD